jgi:RNA polymerase sigma factor (sigma-70 family)
MTTLTVDQITVERVAAGDPLAVDTLVALGWPRLPRLGSLGPGIEAADLRQEAAMTAIAVARQFAGDANAHFVELAILQVRRRLEAIVSAERRRRARRDPADVEAVAPAVDMETRFADEVSDARLATALGRLPPRLRTVLARAYWQGLSAAETAARDGGNPRAVHQLRRRAEALLRAQLNGRATRRRVRDQAGR